MTPRTSSGGRLSRTGTHRIEIDNAGNVAGNGRRQRRRPGRAPDRPARPGPAGRPPGGSTVVRVKVKARKGMLQGSPMTIPFQVVAAPAGAAPVVLDGSLSQRAVLPSGMGQVLIAIVPLLVVAFIAKTVIDNVTKASAGASPSRDRPGHADGQPDDAPTPEPVAGAQREPAAERQPATGDPAGRRDVPRPRPLRSGRPGQPRGDLRVQCRRDRARSRPRR